MSQKYNINGRKLFTPVSAFTNLRIAIPAGWDQFAFWIISFALLIVVGSINRSGLLDHENYLNYFHDTDLNWFINFFESQQNYIALSISFFTEEFLWRIWALTLGFFFSEDQAVLITVLFLNFLVILALSKISNPLFGILLWIFLPPALATIGTFQIRQGFAFSVMLYMVLVARRPFMGYAIAASIHTTFIIVLVYAFVLKISKLKISKSSNIIILVYFLLSLFLALAGNNLFYDYGGRRAEQYSVQQGSDNINYVFGALICLAPSFLHIKKFNNELMLSVELAVVHIGCIFFIIMSWFFFPLGTSRNGYFAFLFLIVILPELRKSGHLTWYVWLLTLVYLGYSILNNYLDGGFNEFLRSL